MFPIPWNRLFRKKDGSLVNIEDAMSGGGGGGGGGGTSGQIQTTRYTANLRAARVNVYDVSSEAPTASSRLIGVVSDLANRNLIANSTSVRSAVGLCFGQNSTTNPNCFYCFTMSEGNDVEFDLIWWVPADT